MLPAILVTFTTIVLELCSSSPVYNMQPAFITNTVGSTAGRNIRNLPCISRRNSNQSGFCMFAIDCLKANGTHLGTCIDGFYFGSCCHIEPVRDITDNNIETDIIPQREPPFRISSTTMKTRITSTMKYDESTTRNSLIDSTMITNMKNQNVTKTSTISTNPTAISTMGSTILSMQLTTPSTTVPQKLQTFQLVENNILEEISTKVPIASTTNFGDKKPNITKEPVVVSSTKRPSTKEPLVSQSAVFSTTTMKIPTTKPTITSLLLLNSTTTHKVPVVNATKVTTTTVSPTKPSKITKIPSTKPTAKPTKASKPTKLTTTTKRPLITSTKSSTITTKPTKKTSSSTKPTKRVTTSIPKLPSSKPTIKIKTTTEKLITKAPSKPQLLSSTVTERNNNSISTKSPISTTTKPDGNKVEVSSGNVATNEIEPLDKPDKSTTTKPGIVTWTVVDNKNFTTSASNIGSFNATTEDWVPITTPDGWVLLPSVGSNVTQPAMTTEPPLSSQTVLQESFSPTPGILLTNATVLSTTAPPTQSPTPSSASENVTVDSVISTSGSNVTNENELSNSSESMQVSTAPTIDRPVNMSDYTDVCGRRMYPEARIVGGEKSAFGKWPWQISLRQWRTSTYLHKCGAALLNENWAITAAHCVDNVPPSDLLLRLGEHDLSTESEPYLHQERRVQIVASHPQFDPRTFEYDLALLRFYEPVTFQPNILPVCVPQTDENFVGRTAYVTGWGRLYEDGPLPSLLQEVSVPVINNTVCESMYRAAGYIEHIPHIFICAGWRRGGFDSCEGDSGGPMVIQRQDKRFLLAGVISWGIGCAEPNQPGVYTRISEFRDWINQILQF